MKKALLLWILIMVNHTLSFCQTVEEIPYERFVGLGSCCITRTQINHHLSTRFNKPITAFGGGQLFDWVIIRDYNKLAEAIENQLLDLLEQADLSFRVYERTYIENTKYDMLWAHLFNVDSNVDLQNFLDIHYQEKKQKIDYLSKKFKQLSQYRTLYIIAYPYEGHRLATAIEPDLDTLLRLRTALEGLRGNTNFSILFCNINKRFEDFENIFVRKIINGPGIRDNVGNYECWHNLLSEFPFSLEKCEADQQTWTNGMEW